MSKRYSATNSYFIFENSILKEAQMSRQTSFKAMYEIVSTYYDYKFEVVDYAVTHTEVW